MGVKKKPTLKILFRQFAISLIVMLVAQLLSLLVWRDLL